jgi:hypothetical protein
MKYAPEVPTTVTAAGNGPHHCPLPSSQAASGLVRLLNHRYFSDTGGIRTLSKDSSGGDGNG